MNSRRHIGCRHIHLEATDSTNSRAAELAHDAANAGTVITADIQTRGRGQHGRVWESPVGVNVLLSVLLFPPPTLRRPVVLTAFAATVVADTILQVTGYVGSGWKPDLPERAATFVGQVSNLTGQRLCIKWPNDVLIDGKKICGILIEGGVATMDAEPHFIVGIGLNVNQGVDDFARLGLTHATSLSMTLNQQVDVKTIAHLLIENLDAEYERLLNGELSALETRWRDRIGLLGQPVTVELMDATERYGRLTEVSFAGLILDQSDGTRLQFVPEMIRHIRPVGRPS